MFNIMAMRAMQINNTEIQMITNARDIVSKQGHLLIANGKVT